ncbi:hypothetical protein [Rhodoferax sp.]|uniref:hypothetical protein n=1 Tax=Rhodoferax sp. TaxID=50421 RepID=UPI00285024A5|nr:hypothetical protein [Rhodoferax sp.]MDR3368245.1 hypothetical protein [Rhodoferax sp.]
MQHPEKFLANRHLAHPAFDTQYSKPRSLWMPNPWGRNIESTGSSLVTCIHLLHCDVMLAETMSAWSTANGVSRGRQAKLAN